jgi:hypothetical protein
MEKLTRHKRNSFAKDDFETYPLWIWDDEMEYKIPLLEKDPAQGQYGTLFLKSKFTIASGRCFDGYLIGINLYYAFGLFVEGEEIVFNKKTPDLNRIDLIKMFCILKSDPFPLFPVYYQSPVRFRGVAPIEGVLDFLAQNNPKID